MARVGARKRLPGAILARFVAGFNATQLLAAAALLHRLPACRFAQSQCQAPDVVRRPALERRLGGSHFCDPDDRPGSRAAAVRRGQPSSHAATRDSPPPAALAPSLRQGSCIRSWSNAVTSHRVRWRAGGLDTHLKAGACRLCSAGHVGRATDLMDRWAGVPSALQVDGAPPASLAKPDAPQAGWVSSSAPGGAERGTVATPSGPPMPRWRDPEPGVKVSPQVPWGNWGVRRRCAHWVAG